MIKPEYRTAPEEPGKISLNAPYPEFNKFHSQAAGIVFRILQRMDGESLQNLVNKAIKAETLYSDIFAKMPGVSIEPEKPFAELEPEKQQQILLAALILHGMAFTQLQKESFKASRAARCITIKNAEEFIYYDD